MASNSDINFINNLVEYAEYNSWSVSLRPSKQILFDFLNLESNFQNIENLGFAYLNYQLTKLSCSYDEKGLVKENVKIRNTLKNKNTLIDSLPSKVRNLGLKRDSDEAIKKIIFRIIGFAIQEDIIKEKLAHIIVYYFYETEYTQFNRKIYETRNVF